MTTPTPTIYQSRSRTYRRRILVVAAVLALVLTGFLIGRLRDGSPAAGSDASPAASSTGPSVRPSAVPSSEAAPPAPTGPAGIDAFAPIQAETPSAQSGVEFQDTADAGGGKNAGWISNGDWLRFDTIDFGATAATGLTARVASAMGDGVNGRMDIRLDDQNSAPIGSLPVKNTGDWQNWISLATDITPVTGVHTVFLTFAADKGDDFLNLNYVRIEH